VDNLALQYGVLDKALAVFRTDTCQPDQLLIVLSIHQYIRRELVSADMRDKVDTHTTGSIIVCVPVKSGWTEMSFQFFFY
jgi:hypothetical protein